MLPTFFGKMCVCRSEDVGSCGQIWDTASPFLFLQNKNLLSNNNYIINNIIIIVHKLGSQLTTKIQKMTASWYHLTTKKMQVGGCYE